MSSMNGQREIAFAFRKNVTAVYIIIHIFIMHVIITYNGSYKNRICRNEILISETAADGKNGIFRGV